MVKKNDEFKLKLFKEYLEEFLSYELLTNKYKIRYPDPIKK